MLLNELQRASAIRSRISAVGGPVHRRARTGGADGRAAVVFGSPRSRGGLRNSRAFFRTPILSRLADNRTGGHWNTGVALKNAYALAGWTGERDVWKSRAGRITPNAHMPQYRRRDFRAGVHGDRAPLAHGGARPGSFAYGLPGAGDLVRHERWRAHCAMGALLGRRHTYDQAREIMAGETLERSRSSAR